MSKFTSGKWEYSEYVPEGITLNGREYLIQADGEDVALARTEANARLIAAAPELYKMLKEELIPTSDYGGILSFAREAKVRKLLTYIDGEEAANE